MRALLQMLSVATVLVMISKTDTLDSLEEETLGRARVVLTWAELNMIGRRLKLAALHDRVPHESDFEQFLGREMRAFSGRDPSCDLWGTAYRLEIDEDLLVVSSSGPDQRAWTEDDLELVIAVGDR